ADAVLWVVDLSDDDILDRLDETAAFLAKAHTNLESMKVLIVGNKNDAPGADDRLAFVKETQSGGFPSTTISAATASSKDREAFKRLVYDFLDVVRVYTKVPGKKPDYDDPYVVARGSTVLDVAEKVHRDFADSLK